MKLERVVSVNADITDVANWFLSKEDMSHKKIQKICYYVEAWSEALLDAPICRNNEFQAWVHGPVNLKLWNLYKDYGWSLIYLQCTKPEEDSLFSKFSDSQLEILNSVWHSYGVYSADTLEAQTHSETPWQEQRGTLPMFASCSNVISVETMKHYYGAMADEQS